MGTDREGDTEMELAVAAMTPEARAKLLADLKTLHWTPGATPAHWSAPADSGGSKAAPRYVAPPVDVTGCGDCPMCDRDRFSCMHPAERGRDTDPLPASPDWCPLRQAPLLVRLRVGP